MDPVRRRVRALVLAGARQQAGAWHVLHEFCGRRQDHAYNVLVKLEERWL
jgi:hypothetical protein